MAWQKYPVPCECGVVHEVAASAAGTSLACVCGKSVRVPSLAKLKASVGQTAVSADFELARILGTGRLPVEDTCGVCGQKTDNRLQVPVVCEQQELKKEHTVVGSLVSRALVSLLTLGFLRYDPGDDPGQQVGRNVAYLLPIRVCTTCAAGKWTTELTRSVLERTPLYARLFDKYPHATVSTPV